MVEKKQSRFDSRWLIVFVAFYGCCLYAGCLVYSFSLFVKPLQTQFGWERAAISLGFTLQFVCLGLLSPFVGKMADKIGNRILIMTGAVIIAIGFLMLPYMQSLLYFYLANIVIGIGGSAVGPVTGSSAVSSVFKENRGMAIGLMSTGIGIGGLAFSPIIGGYLIPTFGWHGGYVGIAIAHLVMVPLAFFFLKAPATSTTVKVSQSAQITDAKDSQEHGKLFTAPFYLISAAFFLFVFSLVGTLQSQVPHLQDIGFPLLTASSALGMLGLVSAFAKFSFGWLCDKIHPKFAFVIAAVFLMGGIALLTVLRPSSPTALLWGYVIVFGIGIGSWLPIMSMITSVTFGMASYGLIFGAVNLVQSIGQALGPLLAGYVFDYTGSYYMAFGVFIALIILSVPLMLSVKKAGVEEKAGYGKSFKPGQATALDSASN